ncbi:MAG: threonine ammonia-lyase [Firmicutes bacterium]|nr:threonine ammonia-lyase [Bacillota bacterium]
MEQSLGLEEIKAARAAIAEIIRVTPTRYSRSISQMTGYPVHFKLECHQKTGSFKLRGAANRILNILPDCPGVIAASAGNHAQGVAYAASQLGLKSTIVMPEGAPLTKAEATRNYGAHVIQQGNNYDECYQVAVELAAEQKLEYIHAFDDKRIIAGQGTIGLELLEQLPEVEQVVVPIGGGGLAAGIASALKAMKPSVRLVGVQAQGADAVYRSFLGGQLTESQATSTIADGIAVKRPGKVTSKLLLEHLDAVVTVSDEQIASAMLLSLERLKTLVEGAGAVGLAAALYQPESMKPVPTAIVVSGGNVDVNLIARIIERGLHETGRLATLQLTIPDRPGNLQKVLNIVAKLGANVISVTHDRHQEGLALDWTQVTMSLETKNQEHIDKLIQALTNSGLKVKNI